MTIRIRAVATALLLCASGAARAGLPPLIERSLLFGNPERAMPLLSPDGTRIAYAAPDDKDVLQVWVRTVGKEDAKAITADKKRGIRIYLWAEDARTVLYLQDNDGDENFHVFGADVETGNVRDYTPFQGVRARVVDVNPDFPDAVLVSTNQRRRDLFDAYRLDLRTGALTLVARNPGDVSTWVADARMAVRGALVTTPEGGTEIRVRDSATAPFRRLLKAGLEDTVALEGFSKDGNSVFLGTSIGHDTARVVERSLRGKKQRTLAESAEVDAGEVLVNPRRHVVEAVSFATGRTEWKVVDPSVAADFEALKTVNDGDFEIVSRDRADRMWIVRYTRDRGPVRYYLWDRSAQTASLVHSERPSLEGLPLAARQPIRYQARDGLTIHGYLTLPVGVEPEKLPLVLYVHGGPWGRDTWGYDPTVQWLANRGYAVLQPNFRGSTGYGKKTSSTACRGRSRRESRTESASPSTADRTAAMRRWRARPSRPTFSSARSTSSVPRTSSHCSARSRRTGRLSRRSSEHASETSTIPPTRRSSRPPLRFSPPTAFASRSSSARAPTTRA